MALDTELVSGDSLPITINMRALSTQQNSRSSPLWSLERGLRIALQAIQQKKALIS